MKEHYKTEDKESIRDYWSERAEISIDEYLYNSRPSVYSSYVGRLNKLSCYYPVSSSGRRYF